jgi:hypothetical protein
VDYSDNTKDIVFSFANSDPDFTLERAWTYDDFIRLNMANSINLTLMPSSAAPETTANLVYDVDSNSFDGYSVFINTNNLGSGYAGHPNDLLCNAYVTNQYLPALPNLNSDLGVNTWAYKASDSNVWLNPDSTPERIKFVTNSTTYNISDQGGISFGAKVNLSQPACGIYGGQVVVTVVAEI